MHEEIEYLLSEGWTLISGSMIESPDGSVQTSEIEKAAHAWRIKRELQIKIAQKFVLTPDSKI